MNNLAFVFPGQGSQTIGMLSDYADNSIVQQTFTEASTALDVDLWQLCQQGPEEKLNQTEFTQPALLTSSVALWRLWNDHQRPLPAYLAGHSLGEYSALVCAESLDFSEAVQLVQKRGQLMQQAVQQGQGAMTAIIGLEDAIIEQICDDCRQGEILSPANFNSPGQVVIAGDTAAVERACAECAENGARKVVMLKVSVPSHCGLMKSASEQLAEEIAQLTLKTPTIPVINNVAYKIEQEPSAIAAALVAQLYQPVQWVQSVQQLAQHDITVAVECGPGKVLSGLNKRITKSIKGYSLATQDSFNQAAAAVTEEN